MSLLIRRQEVLDALGKIIFHFEELEELLLTGEMPEVELTENELKNVDNSLLRMQKGESISLEEFNKKHNFKVQGKRPS